MSQTSRLSIVVDTQQAKQKLIDFTAQLKTATTQATNLATQLRAPMGAAGANAASTSLAGLTAQAAKAQLQQDKLTQSAAKTAIQQQKLAQEVIKTSIAQNNLARSAQAVVIGNQRAEASARRAASGITALSSATNTLNRNWANINLSARTFTPATEAARALSVQINSVTAAAARVAPAANNAAAGLNNLNSASQRADRSARGLHGSMSKLYTVLNSGLVAVTGLGFIKTAAEMQNLNNQIRLVTDSEHEYLLMKQLAGKIADDNFADINSTISLYQKSVRALENLGKSQADSIKFTEAVSLAMRTGGRSAGENAAAILQLGQAMGAGVIMGDEFRSISENAPVLLKLVAKEMGVLQGDLKKLSADGKITAEIMYNAMTKNMAELEQLAKKMPLTMGQAFVVAKNNYKKYTDQLMNSTGGVSDKISGMLVKISANFDTIAKVGIAAVSVGLLSVVANLATATKAMALFNLVASANPLVLIASGFLLVNSAIFGVNEVLTISGIVVSDFFDEMGIMLEDGKDNWKSFSEDVKGYLGVVTSEMEDATDKNKKNIFGLYEETEKGYLGVIQGLGTAMIYATSIFETFFTQLTNWVSNILSAMDNMGRAAHNAGNWVRTKFGGSDNGVPYLSFLETDKDKIHAGIVASRQDDFVDYLKKVKKEAKPKVPFGVYNPDDTTKQSMVNQNFFSVDMTGFVQKGRGASVFARTTKSPTKEENPLLYNNQANRFPSAAGSNALIQKGASDLKAAEEERLKLLKKQGEEKERQNKADSNQIMVYKAWKNAGLSENQARIITAEVGRENDYASKYLFGGHTDPKNKKLNLGMISWQDSREKDLRKYLNDMGLIKGNSIEKSQRGLDAQAQFAVQEMLTNKRFQRTKEQFLSNPDISYNEGTEVLGNNYIAWAYKNQKYANGHTRRDKHYNKLNLDLGNPDVSKDLMAENKAIEELYKERADIMKEYESTPQKIERELIERLSRITAAGFGSEQQESLVGKAIDMANRESLVYTKSLNDLADANNDFRKTELEKIEKNRENLKFEAEIHPFLSLPENAVTLKKVLDDIDYAMDYEVKKDEIKNDRLIDDLYAFKKTEKQVFEDEWKSRLAEAETMTDEIKLVRIDALKEEMSLRQELLRLGEMQEQLDLNKYKLTATEYMIKNIAIQRAQINENPKLTPEQKHEQSQAAGQPIRDALEGMLNGFDNSGTAEGNSYLAVDAQYEENIEKIKAYEKEIGMVEMQAKEERLAAEKEFYRAKAAIMVNDGENIMSSLSSIAKDTMGEQSSIFRAMFAMEKGFAIARSIMNIQVALSSAAASLPFPANLGAISTVAMEGASIISSLKAVTGAGFEKGGYTGSMGTKDIAGVVHGQEYVFDAQSTKRIGVDNLNAMRSGKSVGGGGDVNINVNVDAKGNAQVSGDNERMGRDMANGIKAVVIDTLRKEKRQGGMLYG